jgi:hypothetical protein
MFREIKETQGSLIPRIFTFSKKKNPTNNPWFLNFISWKSPILLGMCLAKSKEPKVLWIQEFFLITPPPTKPSFFSKVYFMKVPPILFRICLKKRELEVLWFPRIFLIFKKKPPTKLPWSLNFGEKKPTPKVIKKIKYPPNTNYLEFRRGGGGL